MKWAIVFCASSNKYIYFLQLFLILGKMVTVASALWQQLSVFSFDICFSFLTLVTLFCYRSSADYFLINHIWIMTFCWPSYLLVVVARAIFQEIRIFFLCLRIVYMGFFSDFISFHIVCILFDYWHRMSLFFHFFQVLTVSWKYNFCTNSHSILLPLNLS